jgi:hyperosmotically inducible protein
MLKLEAILALCTPLAVIACSPKEPAPGPPKSPRAESAMSIADLDVKTGAATHENPPENPAENPIDELISQRVRTAFLADDLVAPESGNIRVLTLDGVVRLSGTVSSAATRERAETTANSVGSVVRVDNRLSIDPNAPKLPAESPADRSISEHVMQALLDDARTANDVGRIRIATREGVVLLSGDVSSSDVRQRMIVDASAVGGVVRVEDRLTIK